MPKRISKNKGLHNNNRSRNNQPSHSLILLRECATYFWQNIRPSKIINLRHFTKMSRCLKRVAKSFTRDSRECFRAIRFYIRHNNYHDCLQIPNMVFSCVNGDETQGNRESYTYYLKEVLKYLRERKVHISISTPILPQLNVKETIQSIDANVNKLYAELIKLITVHNEAICKMDKRFKYIIRDILHSGSRNCESSEILFYPITFVAPSNATECVANARDLTECMSTYVQQECSIIKNGTSILSNIADIQSTLQNRGVFVDSQVGNSDMSPGILEHKIVCYEIANISQAMPIC